MKLVFVAGELFHGATLLNTVGTHDDKCKHSINSSMVNLNMFFSALSVRPTICLYVNDKSHLIRLNSRLSSRKRYGLYVYWPSSFPFR